MRDLLECLYFLVKWQIIVSSKQTAKNAQKILCEIKQGFRELTKDEQKILLVAFARKNKVLYGQGFDIIKCNKPINFMSEKEVFDNLEYIIVYEVKSTNRKDMSKDFANYFFDLTTAELLVAQSLGDQYK